MWPTSAQVLVLQTNNYLGNGYTPQNALSFNNLGLGSGGGVSSVPRTRRNNQPPNMSLFEYQQEIKGVKQEQKVTSRENGLLRGQIKNMERELSRKDQVIK